MSIAAFGASSGASGDMRALIAENDAMTDVELPPPQDRTMEPVGEHAAWSLIGGGVARASTPASSDSAYTKVVCLVCGIGEPLGKIVIGGEHKCFCINGQEFCGLGGTDGCPEADAGCDMYKPTGECFGSFKILCLKMGIECPDKPYLVCCGKELA
mmetsp:Transcript_134367/g.268180  ORF Transcript_134367/g.268180 Transcript_134367/m.268180 type:complete len:156 (-) Transcript_134367:165-632(-)